MPSIPQRAFTSGEVAPQFYGRTDDPRYSSGLRTCKNFLPIQHGALVNRPGTQLVAATLANNPVQFKTFIFSDLQAIVMEFGPNYVTFYAGGSPLMNGSARVQVATPYQAADIGHLNFAQSGDVVTITRIPYAPQDLSRLSNINWTFGATSLSPIAWFGGTFNYNFYKICGPSLGISGTQSWDPAHNYDAGDYAIANQVGADADATGQVFMALQSNVNVAPGESSNSASVANWIAAVDSAHMPQAWNHAITILWQDSNGRIQETKSRTAQGGGGPFVIYTDRAATTTWVPPGAEAFFYKVLGYNIYKGRGTLFGYIGQAGPSDTTFVDTGLVPDYSTQPPQGSNPFAVADGNNTNGTLSYPAVVTYHEQRRVYAGSAAKPNHFQGSAIGNFADFDPNLVQELDSDAYDFGLSSPLLEQIRAAVSIRQLVLLTGQGEFSAEGAPGQPITPTSIRVRKHSYHGSSFLPPLAIGNKLVFNTAKGNYVRDFVYSFQSDTYDGVDLTVLARHLFDGFTIVDWCYCAVPYPIIWVVRSDGLLLSCTYDRDAQIVAWAQHPGFGTIENVCSVPEGTEDAVYLVRNYGAARYVERMASRFFTDVRYCNFLDAAVQFDGHRTTGGEIEISGASYNAQDQVTIACQTNIFVTGVNSTDIGDRIVLDPDGVNGGPFPITITEVTSAASAIGILEKPLSAAYQNVFALVTDSAFARDTVSGLTHLIGQSVKVLADGFVQGPFVVDGTGSIGPLSPPAVVAQVGISYNSDMELLDVAAPSVRTNVKSVTRVVFEVVASRGIYAGETFAKLSAAPARKVSDQFSPPALMSQQVPVPINSSFTGPSGRACLRQSDPLPLTVVAVIREVELGGQGT